MVAKTIHDDGGPALPFEISNGLTMRDYFAAHLPVGDDSFIGDAFGEVLAGWAPPKHDQNNPISVSAHQLARLTFNADVEAAHRYLRADAMLRARQK